MTKEQTRTLGYLCPACRKKVIRPRSAFSDVTRVHWLIAFLVQ